MAPQCDSHLNACLYFTANSLARSVSKMADEAFMVTGLAPSYAFVQMLVNETPGINQNEIATCMNLAPSTVTRFIDKLVERQLLRRELVGKVSKVYPTQKGLELQPLLRQAWAALHERFVAVLGRDFADHLTAEIDRANQIIAEG